MAASGRHVEIDGTISQERRNVRTNRRADRVDSSHSTGCRAAGVVVARERKGGCGTWVVSRKGGSAVHSPHVAVGHRGSTPDDRPAEILHASYPMKRVINTVEYVRRTGERQSGRATSPARRAAFGISPSDPKGEPAARPDATRWRWRGTIAGWRMEPPMELIATAALDHAKSAIWTGY